MPMLHETENLVTAIIKERRPSYVHALVGAGSINIKLGTKLSKFQMNLLDRTCHRMNKLYA
jgi:hypothetical protein